MHTLPTLLEDAGFGTWAQPTGRRKHAPTDGPALLGWLTHISFEPRCQRLLRTPLLTQLSVSLSHSLSLVQALGHAMGFHSSENMSFHSVKNRILFIC